MNREQLEEIRGLYEGWRVGVTCCPQEGSPCTKCAERAAATTERVPALLDEIDRQAQELSANELSEDARLAIAEAKVEELQKRIDKAHDDLTRVSDDDPEDFVNLESTVEYVVRSYRALEKDFNELWELTGGLPLPTPVAAEGIAEGDQSKGVVS